MDFTLPPRKRAKTKEEKEQRRVERILRNRRAAHASREKKRKYVEYLETYIEQLEGNMNKVKENLSPDQLVQLNLKDVDGLKQKIGNINCKDKKDDGEDEDVKLENEGKLEELMVKLEDDCGKVEEQDVLMTSTLAAGTKVPASSSSSVPSVTPESELSFFYLSPISINSPIYSPIDLTLEKLDGVEQNSARILDFKYTPVV